MNGTTYAKLQSSMGDEVAAALGLHRDLCQDALLHLLSWPRSAPDHEPTEDVRAVLPKVAAWLLRDAEMLAVVVSWNRLAKPREDPMAPLRRWAD